MSIDNAIPTPDDIEIFVAEPHKIHALRAALAQLLEVSALAPEFVTTIAPSTDYSHPNWHTLDPSPINPGWNVTTWASSTEFPEWVRRLKRLSRDLGYSPGSVQKFSTSWAFGVELVLAGAVRIRVETSRDNVCTQVVTGTEVRTVTKVVVPAVTEEVEETVEVTEWVCPEYITDPN